MCAKTSLSPCEVFTVRHFSGIGVVFLAVVLLAAGCGVIRGLQADRGDQLFAHSALQAGPEKH